MFWGIFMDLLRILLRDWGNCFMSFYWLVIIIFYLFFSFIIEFKLIYLIVIDRFENVCLKNN